jgi:hypothetical protein
MRGQLQVEQKNAAVKGELPEMAVFLYLQGIQEGIVSGTPLAFLLSIR